MMQSKLRIYLLSWFISSSVYTVSTQETTATFLPTVEIDSVCLVRGVEDNDAKQFIFPVYVTDNFICQFLKRAQEFHQAVNVKMDKYTSSTNTSLFMLKKAHFGNASTTWQVDKSEEFYMLEGLVEDVYYNSEGICHVAITPTGDGDVKDKRYRAFHHSYDMSLCQMAEDAYYKGLRVEIVANTVNGKSWSNTIEHLKVIAYDEP